LVTVAVNAPGWFPLAVGVKLTATRHEEVARSVVEQVVSVGTRLYGPVRSRVKSLAACPLRLLMVRVRGVAVVPTAVDGKLNSGVLDCKAIGGTPVPVRLTVVVDGIALLAVMVSVAPSIPATEGENVT
jgi:hypothetical protein